MEMERRQQSPCRLLDITASCLQAMICHDVLRLYESVICLYLRWGFFQFPLTFANEIGAEGYIAVLNGGTGRMLCVVSIFK